MIYTLRTDIALPHPLSKFRKPAAERKPRTRKYPFADLAIGMSFVVPVEPDKAEKAVKSNLSRIASVFRKELDVTDRKFVVRTLIDDAGNRVLDDQGRVQIAVFAVQPDNL